MLPVVNAYFAFLAVWRFLTIRVGKPLTLALAVVDVSIFLVGIPLAIAAFAYVQNPRPATVLGWIFGLAFLAVELAPSFIQLQVRRIERGD